VQHIRSRKSRADENSHEIYVEIVSCGNDVVRRLREGMRSDVIVHVISAVAPVGDVASVPAGDSAASVRHNVSLDRTDTQCTTVSQLNIFIHHKWYREQNKNNNKTKSINSKSVIGLT